MPFLRNLPSFCLSIGLLSILVLPMFALDYERFDTEALGEEIDGWTGANAYCLEKGLVLLSESQLCPNGQNNFPIGGVAVNSNPNDIIISAVSGNNNYVILTGTLHNNLKMCEGNIPENTSMIVADGKHSEFSDFYENKFIYCTAPAATMSGDPHVVTFKDVKYSWHGGCTAILSRSVKLGIEIHVRTHRIETRKVAYSYIADVAAKVCGNIIEVAGADGSLIVSGKKKLITMSDSAGALSLSGGCSLVKTVKGSRGQIVVYDLDLGGDRSMQIRANTNNGMIYVDLYGSYPNAEGLLGSTSSEALLGRDGVTDFAGNFNSFAEDWQVLNTEQNLFQELHGPQHPAGCVYDASMMEKKGEDFKRPFIRRRLMDRDAVTLEEAKKACTNTMDVEKRKLCVTDVMAVGDIEIAEDAFYN